MEDKLKKLVEGFTPENNRLVSVNVEIGKLKNELKSASTEALKNEINEKIEKLTEERDFLKGGGTLEDWQKKISGETEEKTEQPEIQNTPEVSEPEITTEEKIENEPAPETSQEEVKETPVVESTKEAQVENGYYESKKQDIERRRQEELNKPKYGEKGEISVLENFKNSERRVKEYKSLQKQIEDANSFTLNYAPNGHYRLVIKNSNNEEINISSLLSLYTDIYFSNTGHVIKNIGNLTIDDIKYLKNDVLQKVKKEIEEPWSRWVNDFQNEINEINAKYDAELADLDRQFGKEVGKKETQVEKAPEVKIEDEKNTEEQEDLDKKELLKKTISDFRNIMLNYSKLYLELNDEKRQLQELIEKRNLELQSTVEREIIKEDLTIEQAVELLKNNKISQIVVAGNYDKKLEEMRELKPDLDTLGALHLLNNLNKNPIGEVYAEGAVTSVVGKGGQGKELIEKKGGLVVYLDTGGEWLSIEKDGEKKTLYIDHHGSGKRESTSGTKMIYEIMRMAETLEEKPWVGDFVKFINDVDNLNYIKSKNFTENYLINSWPQSLYALAEKHIPFEKVVELFESGVVKDPSLPFTDEQIKNNIGDNLDIKDVVQETRKQIRLTLDGIKNAIEHNKRRGLNLESKDFGKIIYHDYFKEKNKVNTIIDHLAAKAMAVKGYDTYIVYSKKPPRIYINTLKKDLDLKKVASDLGKATGSEVKDLRGVFIFKNIDINKFTEKQFLDTLDPNILKDAKY